MNTTEMTYTQWIRQNMVDECMCMRITVYWDVEDEWEWSDWLTYIYKNTHHIMCNHVMAWNLSPYFINRILHITGVNCLIDLYHCLQPSMCVLTRKATCRCSRKPQTQSLGLPEWKIRSVYTSNNMGNLMT